MKITIFSKKNCSPCKQLKEHLKNYPEQEYKEINPFDNPELAARYKVRSTPTIILEGITGEEKKLVGFNVLTVEVLDNILRKKN